MARRAGHGLSIAGHIAASFGAYRTGHIARGAGQTVRMVSSFGEEGALAGGGAAALGAAAGAAVIAIGALVVSVKAVEIGFKTLEKTATELVGAIAQLGGAKGLQAMMVESVTNEKLLSQARMNVLPGERMSKQEIMSLATSLSEKATAGAFSTNEWLGAIKDIGILSGQQKSVSKDTLEFLGGLSLVGGTNVDEMAKVYGRIKAKSPGSTDDQIKDIMLAGHGIGLTGSFSISEIPDAGKLMRLTSRLAGGASLDNYKQLFSVGTILKQGGNDLENAGVLYNQFLSQAYQSKAFKFNKAAELENSQQVLEKLVSTPTSQLNQHLMKGRSGQFVQQLLEGVSQKAGVEASDFSSEANDKRKQALRDMENVSYGMKEFQKDIEESLTPQEKFRAAFNRISNNLEAEFLPVMQRLEPVVSSFADRIVDKKEEIGDYFQKLSNWLAVGVEVLPSFLTVVGALAAAIGKVAGWLISMVTGAPGSLEAAQEKLKATQEARKLVETEGGLTPEQRKAALAEGDKAIAEAQKNVSLWNAFTELSPENIKKKLAAVESKDAADKAAAEALDKQMGTGTGRKASYDEETPAVAVQHHHVIELKPHLAAPSRVLH